MSAIVNIYTKSDADFVRGFVMYQSYPAWDAATFYEEGKIVDHAGSVWTAEGDTTGVTPGIDPDVWSLTARPVRDLTDCTLAMMVRKTADATEAKISLTSEGIAPGIEITDDDGGAFTLKILREAWLKNLPPGTYVQSLIMTRPDGLKEALWRGKLVHEVGPTR